MFPAFTKCGFCGKSGTKTGTIEPSGAAFKQVAIVCSHCNSILGITGYYDTGDILKRNVEPKIEKMERQVQHIEYQLQQVLTALRRQ